MSTIDIAVRRLMDSGLLPIRMARLPRTSDVQIEQADAGSIVNATGTFTQTFASAAALGVGFQLHYANTGTGTISLTGVSGLASIIPGALALIHSDGATIRGFTLNASGLGQPNGFASLDSLGQLPDAQANGLGYKQTWQTISRNTNTTYQNAGSKPIMVSAFQASNQTIAVTSADNTTFVEASRGGNGSSAAALVAPGHYYRFNSSVGTAINASEFR